MPDLTTAAARAVADALHAASERGEGLAAASSAGATAVLELLAPVDHHLVDLSEDSFTVTHPLTERFAGTMHECQLFQWLHAQDGPPKAPGRYRATRREQFVSETCGAAWELEPVDA